MGEEANQRGRSKSFQSKSVLAQLKMRIRRLASKEKGKVSWSVCLPQTECGRSPLCCVLHGCQAVTRDDYTFNPFTSQQNAQKQPS